MLIVVVVFLLALLAGCGSSGDDSSSGSGAGADEGSTTVSKTWNGSKQAYVKKADAICAQDGDLVYRNIVKTISPAGVNGANKPNYTKAVEVALAPTMEAELRKIRALGFPAGDEEEVEAVLTAVEEQLERAQAEPDAFLEEGDPFKESSEAGKAYGFSVCGGVA